MRMLRFCIASGGRKTKLGRDPIGLLEGASVRRRFDAEELGSKAEGGGSVWGCEADIEVCIHYDAQMRLYAYQFNSALICSRFVLHCGMTLRFVVLNREVLCALWMLDESGKGML